VGFENMENLMTVVDRLDELPCDRVIGMSAIQGLQDCRMYSPSQDTWIRISGIQDPVLQCSR